MPHSYGFNFAPVARESGRMNLKSTNVTAGNAMARKAKISIGMYCLGIVLSGTS
jgi:hypothetical protein